MNRDYILVRDGDSPMSRPIARLTGKSEDNPTVIMSTGSNLYLYFKTSLGDSKRGFSIRFTQGCKATIIARNGTVQSPSYNLNDYPNNQECLYRIKNPDRGPLSLKFVSFNVHKTDYVQVSAINYVTNAMKVRWLFAHVRSLLTFAFRGKSIDIRRLQHERSTLASRKRFHL